MLSAVLDMPVLDTRTAAEVERIIRDVAARDIMPYFGRLGPADIDEKGPGDLVTVADRTAEESLTAALTTVLPGSVVAGEEGISADPAIGDSIAGDVPVWIVDPIDGTHNFVADNVRFAVLVALALRGELLASWTYAPALDMMATATRGGGAYVDGSPVRVRPAGGVLRHLDVHAAQRRWWTESQRVAFNALCRHGVSLAFFDTSGLEYIELASGRRSVMIVTWENPWDHAAGLLLHAEAGGVARTAVGERFLLAGGNTLPLVVAPDALTAERVHAALAGATGAPGQRTDEAGQSTVDRSRSASTTSEPASPAEQ
jgi:fructose-1,6-bisphosphatase/inositol monophosphatase family enzyme